MTNPLLRLREAGQSVWLDYLRRGLIAGGGLARLVREDGLGGVTSNPTIFRKAIGGSSDYEQALRALVAAGKDDPREIFYDLALEDIRDAADVLRPVYDETGGRDGFVSFELEADLARDTAGSVKAARDLFAAIDRLNVMIKVPGTAEGVGAVEELTAAGVNVNITLLFAVDRYEEVARAYVAGLQRRLEAGERVDRPASVASFFVSRVDSEADAALGEDSPLRGRVAIANAKLAYGRFGEIFAGEVWRGLAAAGARVQRPLWASTSTKDPSYRDVLYVEQLVGPDTVNTMPERTMDAFRDHGEVDPAAVTTGVEEAVALLGTLGSHGVDLAAIAERLVDDGIAAFDEDFRGLLETIEEKVGEVRAGGERVQAALGSLETAVAARLDAMRDGDVPERIWRRDHTVWQADPTEIADRLGWLDVTEPMRERVADLRAFAERAAADGFTRAVLCGMGGSSLAPEVLRHTLGVADGALDLIVLDSTHPATVARVTADLDLDRTLFLIASKSGSTIETTSHLRYFHGLTGGAGDRFVAITDPGSPLESLAREQGFRAVFRNPADIGGRYSALSLFGLVPAALIGADLDALLGSAEEMAVASAGCLPCEANPSAWLGAVLGEAARAGRDKLTLLLDPSLERLGDWIEQLVAESTGKDGTGILPVVGEPLGEPAVYAPDRLFVAIGEGGGLEALEREGHPVVRLTAGPGDLGAEFFRWELATAVAGHVLGIHPFDQPNVAEAKAATAEILEAGAPDEAPPERLEPLLGSIRGGDYVALLAYLDATPETIDALRRARARMRDRYRVATTLGFGPRYLHSTGQLHKGGPPSGVFVQIVDETRGRDISIPGVAYTFGGLIDAQAAGDLRSLRARGRRVARVTLPALMEVIG